AGLDDGAAERNGLGTDRHAAKIGIEIYPGENLSRAGAQSRTHFLPVIAITAFDRVFSGLHEFAISLAELALLAHFASSFRPSRISVETSALPPALRLAAATAATANGWA